MKKQIKKRIARLFIHPFRLIEFSIILNWLKPQKGEKICDVACGRGLLSSKIATRGCLVYGLDLSNILINKAKIFSNGKGMKCKFIIGNAEYLPYRSRIFDKVVSNCSLEHFQDDIKAMKEMNRVLKPSGTLVLTVDSLSYPGIKKEVIEMHKKVASAVNYYTCEQLKERLERAGLRMICSKCYLNSFISSFLFNLGIRLKWCPLWVILSFTAYPLCLLSDRLFGIKDKGYGLAIKGEKAKAWGK